MGCLNGYMAVACCLYYEKNVRDAINYRKLYYQKISTVSDKVHKKIMKTVFLRRYIFLINILFINILFVFHLPIFGYEDEYYFPVFFFDRYLLQIVGGAVVRFLKISFYSSLFPCFLIAAVPMNLTAYWLSHMQYQMIILEDNLKNFMKSFDGRNILFDGTQQKIITYRLKFCIEHYYLVRRSMTRLQKWLFWPLIISVCCGFIYLLSYIYFIIAQASKEAAPRVLAEGVVSSLYVMTYAICGQGLVDQAFKFTYSSLAAIQHVVAIRHKAE